MQLYKKQIDWKFLAFFFFFCTFYLHRRTCEIFIKFNNIYCTFYVILDVTQLALKHQ